MDLAWRLVDEATLVGDPVVLQISPFAANHVADNDHGVSVPTQHARFAHAQQVAPAPGDGVEEERAKADVLGLWHPDTLVLGHRLQRELGNDAGRRQDQRSVHHRAFFATSYCMSLSARVSSATSRSTSRSLGNGRLARRYQ